MTTPTPAGWRQLMNEVKFGDTTADQAAQRVEEYIRQEVERRIARALNPEPRCWRWTSPGARNKS